MSPSSRSSYPLAPGGIFFQQSRGCTPVTRVVTNHHLCNPGNEPPRNVAGISNWDTEHWGSLEGSNVLSCHHRPSRLVSKGWAPRTKAHLIYPCKQVTETKSKAQPAYCCMWLHWPFYSPSPRWAPSYFTSNFISLLCHPFPLPHYQTIACLFLFWSSSLLHVCVFIYIYIYTYKYTHTHTHTHTELLFSLKEEWNYALLWKINGIGDHAKWNKAVP
jgi:hypothetical protein